MSNVERTANWQQIQQGVKEAEQLTARKEYNLAMVKARQVPGYVVRCMAERACMVEGDLSDIMDQLYEGQWISKAARDNYHTIRILGNKAVHEGDGAAHDANRAFQLLIQKMYVLANEFAGGAGDRVVRSSPAVRSTSGRPVPKQGLGGGRSAPDRNGQRVPARNTRSGSSRQGGPRKKHRCVSPAAYILRLLIPMLLVILLIVAIRVFIPGKDRGAGKTTTAPAVTTVPVGTAPTLPPEPETEPETESPAGTYRVKGSSVSVRSEPSISDRVSVQLGNDIKVVHVKRYDNSWAVINYNGQEAHVSNKFIEEVEPVTLAGGETGGNKAQTDNQASVLVRIIQKKLVILDAKRGRIQRVLPLFGISL